MGTIFAQTEPTLNELFSQIKELEKEEKYYMGLDLIEKILEIDPTNLEAQGIRCTFLLNTDSPPEQIKVCINNVLLQDPHNFLSMLNLGVLYANIGDYEKAKDEFERILEIYPNNIQAESRFYTISLVLDPSDEEYFQKLEKLFKQTQDIKILNNIIKFRNDNNQFVESKQLWNIALELDPKNPNTLGHVGVWYAKQGDFQNAERYFLHALNENPEDITTLNNIALVYRDLGDKFFEKKYYHTAIGYYESVLRLESNNVWAQNGIEHSQKQLNGIEYVETLQFFTNIGIATIVALVSFTVYYTYRKYRNSEISLQSETTESIKDKIRRKISHSKLFIVAYSGGMSIVLVLVLVPIFSEWEWLTPEDDDVSNWVTVTAELGFAAIIAGLVWIYDSSKQKQFDEQQKKTKELVDGIHKMETTQLELETKLFKIIEEQEKSQKERVRWTYLGLIGKLEFLKTTIYERKKLEEAISEKKKPHQEQIHIDTRSFNILEDIEQTRRENGLNIPIALMPLIENILMYAKILSEHKRWAEDHFGIFNDLIEVTNTALAELNAVHPHKVIQPYENAPDWK